MINIDNFELTGVYYDERAWLLFYEQKYSYKIVPNYIGSGIVKISI